MMVKKFYIKFLMPLSTDQNVQAREFVLNSLLMGSMFFCLFAILINLLVSLTILHHSQVIAYFPALFVSLLFFLGLYALARRGKYRVAAGLLVAGYSLPAILLVRQWGILVPESILLFALVIVLSGILLGSRYAFINSLIVTGILTVFLILQLNNAVVPDISWGKQYGTVADVLGFAITFAILGIVTWLYNWRMEQSLSRAVAAERALQRQKEHLEDTVEKRTRQLQVAQADKMKQLHHFAELGHVSTALLHDLSNHLAMLTLDIESLGSSQSNRQVVVRQAQSSITYIEELVKRVSYQLQGESIVKDFNVVEEITEVMQLLAYKAKQAQVTLELIVEPKQTAYKYAGDFVGFRQLISNLLANSIEAYDNGDAKYQRHVTIKVARSSAEFIITITDKGKGIRRADLNKIFNPFFSTREEGMGIGLFIARQLAEEQFKGHLTVTSKLGVGTSFTIQLPRRQK